MVNRTKDGFLNEMQPGHSVPKEALGSKAFFTKRIVPIPSQAVPSLTRSAFLLMSRCETRNAS
jgi:hypothetical protein